MDEDDRRALADIMDVRADAAGLDGLSNLRMRFTHDPTPPAALRKATRRRPGSA